MSPLVAKVSAAVPEPAATVPAGRSTVFASTDRLFTCAGAAEPSAAETKKLPVAPVPGSARVRPLTANVSPAARRSPSYAVTLARAGAPAAL